MSRSLTIAVLVVAALSAVGGALAVPSKSPSAAKPVPFKATAVFAGATARTVCAVLASPKVGKCWGYGSNADSLDTDYYFSGSHRHSNLNNNPPGSGGGYAYGLRPGEMGNFLPSMHLPVGVATTTTITTIGNGIDSGYARGCMLLSTGQVACYGSNRRGLRGSFTQWSVDYLALPNIVKFETSQLVASMSVGGLTTAVVFKDGTFASFGDGSDYSNFNGQWFGLGYYINEQAVPLAKVGSGWSTAHAAVGYGHTCVLSTKGKIKCAGLNQSGQCGQNDTSATNSLVGQGYKYIGDHLPLVSLSSTLIAKAVYAGGYHSCAALGTASTTSALKYKCWGLNNYGQLGYGASITQNVGTVPGQMGDALPFVDLGSNVVVSMSLGNYHSVMLTSTGQLIAFGDNQYGQLGVGSTTVPTDVPANLPYSYIGGKGLKVTSVAAGDGFTCFVANDGFVRCMGYNYYGALGTGQFNTQGTSLDDSGSNMTVVDLGSSVGTSG